MIISHVKISTFQTIIIIVYGYFILPEKTVVYIINRTIHMCLEIPDLFLMFNTQNKSGISAHPCIILYILIIGVNTYFTQDSQASKSPISFLCSFDNFVLNQSKTVWPDWKVCSDQRRFSVHIYNSTGAYDYVGRI